MILVLNTITLIIFQKNYEVLFITVSVQCELDSTMMLSYFPVCSIDSRATIYANSVSVTDNYYVIIIISRCACCA